MRALILASLPPQLRAALRSARARVQRAESRLRNALPAALGGRLELGALTCRVLDDRDRLALHALRPMPGSDTQEIVSGPDHWMTGVWLHGTLIASGACVRVGPSDTPLQSVLFTADFVLPRMRRRGVARVLHRARLREAAARGVHDAYAWVHEVNGAAFASLHAAGFERLAREQQPTWLPAPTPSYVLLRATCEDRA